MRHRRTCAGWGVFLVLAVFGCGAEDRSEGPESDAPMQTDEHPSTLELWQQGVPAFGVFVPDERPRDPDQPRGGQRLPPVYSAAGAARLADNPLYDFLFLNLEGAYDVAAVEALSNGLRGDDGRNRKTLLVRIPPISADGEEAARTRVTEILRMGGDGVVLPHVRSVEEARTALSFFAEAGADVWSPENPDGDVVAMLMLEDPEAVEQAGEIAALGGISVLACGIGSLTQAMGGDREAAEAGNQRVLDAARRTGAADMITANAENVAQRIDEGFLALLMAGPTADEAISVGRTHAGR